jgi:hypothetical protein
MHTHFDAENRLVFINSGLALAFIVIQSMAIIFPSSNHVPSKYPDDQEPSWKVDFWMTTAFMREFRD